ncbi:GDSL esterase/lipase 6-like [Telopea speciosissima]|uniref:GDSL esterase/lipase 6-like n=1 Tax=Telopea speciosissima TaxID=54955 RepID=UPI001CC3A22E|nr:GDSL esterase/lipase 6-like [Telopea speciosissima]
MASSYNVETIFTFGDSILDAGNNHFIKNCTMQADFPPYGSSFFHHPTGRFTNGRTVVDFLSEYLGIDLQQPYLQVEMEVVNGSQKDYPSNGINFASAGSGVFRETNKEYGVISINDQLEQFETLMKSNQMDKKLVQKSLFLFEAGSNDIFNYFSPFKTTKLSPEAFSDAMLVEVEKWINQTYQLGARRFGIISLGCVGCVPARALLPGAPIDQCYEKMNQMAIRNNLDLEGIVKGMPRKCSGTLGVYGAVYDIVQLFRATTKRYGFLNTSSACCGGGTLGGMKQCGDFLTVYPGFNMFPKIASDIPYAFETASMNEFPFTEAEGMLIPFSSLKLWF